MVDTSFATPELPPRRERARQAPAHPASACLARLGRLASALLHVPHVRIHLLEEGALRLRHETAPLDAEVARGAEAVADEVVRSASARWSGGGGAGVLAADATVLAVPLRAGAATLGALSAIAPRSRSWTREERAGLQDLAAACSVELSAALERARSGLRSESATAPSAPPPDLADAVPAALLVTDAGGIVRAANLRAGALLGRAAHRLRGRPIANLLPENERAAFAARLAELRELSDGVEWPLRLASRPGVLRPVVCHIAPLPASHPAWPGLSWLILPREEAEAPEARPARGGREAHPDEWRLTPLLERYQRAPLDGSDATLLTTLRELITGEIHAGGLREGDRLPSIRVISRLFGVTTYAAMRAYAALEVEGLVERRDRSGIYVAPLEPPERRPLPETAVWLAGILTQACEHRLKVPLLPELIRRWTAALPIRCTCVESCLDLRVALALELQQQFGMEARASTVAELRAPARGSGAPPPVAGSDLLVTTAFHAGELRALAGAGGKPLLVATLHPQTVLAIEARLREGSLTVVCADAAFGERIRGLRGGIYRDRVRVVLAADAAAVSALRRDEPVLLTYAARQRLGQTDLRLITPLSPVFSLDFARKVAEVVVRLHIEAERA